MPRSLDFAMTQGQVGFFAQDWRALGVVVGMASEARIARRLGAPVAIGGGSAAGARLVAERLVAHGASALLSFGLAGGLAPGLHAGAVLVPGEVVTEGGRFTVDPALAGCLGGFTSHVVYGADEVVASVEAKRTLHERTGCDAVDLESGAVAGVARARRVPFAVLRAVCDPAGRALPSAAVVALTVDGTVDVRRVIGSIMGEPGQIGGLLALARDAAVARRALMRTISRRPKN